MFVTAAAAAAAFAGFSFSSASLHRVHFLVCCVYLKEEHAQRISTHIHSALVSPKEKSNNGQERKDEEKEEEEEEKKKKKTHEEQKAPEQKAKEKFSVCSCVYLMYVYFDKMLSSVVTSLMF